MLNRNGEIRGLGGKCLDLSSNNTTNRTLFQIWDCNGAAARKFYPRGDLRGPGNLCLETRGRDSRRAPVSQFCMSANSQNWEHHA